MRQKKDRTPKILVIDDEESIRFTFESFLTEEGYAVVTAGNYDDAMARISFWAAGAGSTCSVRSGDADRRSPSS